MRATLRSAASFLLLGAVAVLLLPAPGLAQNPSEPGGGFRGARFRSMDSLIEARFHSYDRNGDGLLNNDEMPDSLKAERDKWDTNHDGFIDLNEFKAYAQARMQLAQAGRGGPPPAAPVPPRISWEYKAMDRDQVLALAPTKKAPDALTVGLNKLSAEGWELVTITPASEFVFKRPAEGGRREEAASPASKREARAEEFRIFRLKNADAIELSQTLMQLFRGADGKAPRLVGDGRTNSLLAAGSPEQLESVEALINELDRPAVGKAEPKQK